MPLAITSLSGCREREKILMIGRNIKWFMLLCLFKYSFSLNYLEGMYSNRDWPQHSFPGFSFLIFKKLSARGRSSHPTRPWKRRKEGGIIYIYMNKRCLISREEEDRTSFVWCASCRRPVNLFSYIFFMLLLSLPSQQGARKEHH